MKYEPPTGVVIPTPSQEEQEELYKLDLGLTKVQRQLAVASLVNQHTYSVDQAAKKYGLSRSSINRARAILDKAAPHVRQMVADGQVPTYMAERAVQHAPLETQATWTVVDVMREAKMIIRNQPKRQAEPPPLEPPPSVNLTKLDIGPLRKRGDQRVFLWPPHIQDLHDDKVQVVVAIGAVFALHWECEPDAFGAALKRLLAYTPVPDKDNGEEKDFAADARKELKLIANGKIRKAIDWLTGLEAAIADAIHHD